MNVFLQKLFPVLIVFVLLLSGCAAPKTRRADIDDALVEVEAHKQKEIALNTYRKYQTRLNDVSFPLLIAALPWCEKKTAPKLGIHYANKYSFDDEFQDPAISVFKVGEPLQVMSIAKGSPAAAAGLAVGDILVTINDIQVPTGKDAAKKFRTILEEELKPDHPAQVTLFRDDQRKEYSITPATACNYPVLLGTGEDINAYADGKVVVITKGMIRFVDDDQELSFVIAHELAHNSMAHIQAKTKNFAIGTILDILAAAYGVNTQGTFGNIGAGAYSKAFEEESDYVALYILARADQQIENVAGFWRKLAAENPGSIKKTSYGSHPSSPERFVAIENTVLEINQKKETGEPLLPEMKE
jgi:membrane-associated protease RseP (regulator of RpoE activity)